MSQKLSFFSPQDNAFGQNRTIFWAKKFPERSMLQISKPFLSLKRNDQGRPEVPYFSPDLFINIFSYFPLMSGLHRLDLVSDLGVGSS